jgi:hypothetical protein
MGKRALEATVTILICNASNVAQERRLRRVAQAKLMSDHGLVMWTITEVLLQVHGLDAPIWLTGMPQCSQASQPDSSLRQCAFAKVGKRISCLAANIISRDSA